MCWVAFSIHFTEANEYLPRALRLLNSRQYSSTREQSKLCILVARCLRVDGSQEAVEWLEQSCQQRSQLNVDDLGRLLLQRVLAGAY
jgi:hypothetical protein